MLKIKELIKILQTKDQDKEVECAIIGTDNSVQVLMLENSAENMSKILKLFPKKDSK